MENIKPATLLYIVKDGKILLGKKLKGFGEGFFNGVGGKFEDGENAEQAMLRETMEEIGVVPKNYSLRAKLIYNEFFKGEPVQFQTYVFVASDYDGEVVTTEEIEPYWFDMNAIPYKQMFGDDPYWLPDVLEGKKVYAEFEFDKDFKILNYKVDFVDEIQG